MATQLISDDIETFTNNQIFADLKKGDPKWDLPHTTAVVHYTKEIIKSVPELNVDSTVLIIAAYAHDWGYSEFYKPGESLTKEEYLEAKKTHAEISLQKLDKLLTNSVYNTLSTQQKERIKHLVLNHENLEGPKALDESILMEADTLGGLDTDFITPTWTKEQSIRHVSVFREKRFPLFVTDYAKKAFEECANKRMTAALGL